MLKSKFTEAHTLVLTSLVMTILTLAGPKVDAAEIVRYFEGLDDQTKVWIGESGDSKVNYFKMSGINHPDADRVFIFEKHKEDEFAPAFKASNLILQDYDRGTLVEGSIKKYWSLGGIPQTDPKRLIEKKAAANISFQELKAAYETSEGGQANQAEITSLAKTQLGRDCLSQPSVEVKTQPVSKGKPVVEALAAVCKTNKAYSDVVKGLRKVQIVDGGKADSVTVKETSGVLTITLPKNLHNTYSATFATLKDEL